MSARPELVIPVADLERGPKDVEFQLSEAWLAHALEDSGATALQAGRLTAHVSRNGADVLVRGQLEVQLVMPCVITLDPVPVDVRTEILLMLSPQAGAPSDLPNRSSGRRRATTRPERDPADPADPAKPLRNPPSKGSRGAKTADSPWADTPTLEDETAGRDTFDGHQIVLDDFAREFLILELPMFPRRSDLPTEPSPANPPLPAGSPEDEPSPIDPRLSPLAELKSRLEKINKE